MVDEAPGQNLGVCNQVEKARKVECVNRSSQAVTWPAVDPLALWPVSLGCNQTGIEIAVSNSSISVHHCSARLRLRPVLSELS